MTESWGLWGPDLLRDEVWLEEAGYQECALEASSVSFPGSPLLPGCHHMISFPPPRPVHHAALPEAR